MNPHYGKSRFIKQKQSTKSGIEDNTPEEEELKKYKELIEAFDNELKNGPGKIKDESMYSSSNNGGDGGNNKSSFMRRTASRTKEMLNNRDFLLNVMNNDTMPISPKNMHLLSDNDTNQSITNEAKYKNLADLMVEDTETFVESHFIRKVEDRLILKLYTALSRKSNDIFMDENHEEQYKNRILFHKINDINIPKFEFYDHGLNNGDHDSDDSIDFEAIQQNILNLDKNSNIYSQKVRSYSERVSYSRKFNNNNVKNDNDGKIGKTSTVNKNNLIFTNNLKNQNNNLAINLNNKASIDNNANFMNNNAQNDKKNSLNSYGSNILLIEKKNTTQKNSLSNTNNMDKISNFDNSINPDNISGINKLNSINNINLDEKMDNSILYENFEEEKENENKLKFNENCKYNKKRNQNVIKIPKLTNYNPYRDKYHSRRIHKNKPQNLWEPEVDGDLLAYINHNIISIEDIYNKGKEKILNINNSREDDIKTIEAKEVLNEGMSNSLNDIDIKEEKNNKSMDNNSIKKEGGSNAGEDEENEGKTRNKFCEFKDRHPNLIEISLPVDPTKQKLNTFHSELKEIFYSRINEVGEFSEDIFPSKGVDLKNMKIYRYAINNERNEEVSTDRITILSTTPPSPPPTPHNTRKEKNNSKKKKTTKKRKISEDNYISKIKKENIDNDNININLNMNFSDLLKKESDKFIRNESNDKGETNVKDKNEDNSNKNNAENNFSLFENNENDISDDKKSLNDKLNKIFNNESINLSEEKNINIEKNKNIENEIKKDDEDDEDNKDSKDIKDEEINDNINLTLNQEDKKKSSSSNSNISNNNYYKDENQDNILNLSFSRNSGD